MISPELMVVVILIYLVIESILNIIVGALGTQKSQEFDIGNVFIGIFGGL